jgi:hypothetical protein
VFSEQQYLECNTFKIYENGQTISETIIKRIEQLRLSIRGQRKTVHGMTSASDFKGPMCNNSSRVIE